MLCQAPFQPPPAAHGTSETLTGLLPSRGGAGAAHGADVPAALSGRPVHGLPLTEAPSLGQAPLRYSLQRLHLAFGFFLPMDFKLVYFVIIFAEANIIVFLTTI